MVRTVLDKALDGPDPEDVFPDHKAVEITIGILVPSVHNDAYSNS